MELELDLITYNSAISACAKARKMQWFQQFLGCCITIGRHLSIVSLPRDYYVRGLSVSFTGFTGISIFPQ